MKNDMKVYKITLMNEKSSLRNVQFYRTSLFISLWDILEEALESAKEKSKEENDKWAIEDIKRVD